MPDKRLKTSNVIGARVDAGRMNDAVSAVMERAQSAEKPSIVCVANVHSVVTARRDTRFQSLLRQAWMVVSDGMPLVWVLRRQCGAWVERVTGPDLMLELCAEAEKKGIPICFFGGSNKQMPRFKKQLRKKYPELGATFIVPPKLPENPLFDQAVVNAICDASPGIVFIGLGCPKQELWMQAHASHIPSVLIGVGAAFDFIAGTKKRAPQWMRTAGLEWFFRLMSEPRRLWKRYFVTNSLFLFYIMKSSVLSMIRKSDKDA